MARLFDDAQSEYLERDEAPVTAVPLTMACWFYTDEMENYQALMFIGDKAAENNFFTLRLSDDHAGNIVEFDRRSAAARTQAQTTAGFNINTWHHACAVASATDSAAVFLDGGNKGTEVTDITPVGLDRVSIARYGDDSPGTYMSGRIAEAAIWNVALTDAEVAGLGDRVSPLFIRPQNLVAYWPLIRDEDRDPVGGFDLTAFNAPSIAAHAPMYYLATPYQISGGG